ncbi:CRE-ZTF-20 protein [Caenorhabditis remanei]|uniref:CRE-ZTF-20 protein n=1 Tax=Caenorhabditis remanei TaxID=31234 RepID=E3N0I9_CAERE|nr:CRE-ZTF-20 protein [Caenorhabditis remanei]
MNKFLEQLEILKTTFSELPEECLIDAIERMDQTVEQLSRSVVFVEGDPQADYLADMGKDVVQDFLHTTDFDFFSSAPSTSSNDFPIQFPNFPSTDIQQIATSLLYCYTCGEGFNNRKALYRHGKATNHSTRPSKCHREVEAQGEEIQKTLGIQTSSDSDERRPVENLNNLRGPSDISLASLHLGQEDFLDSTSFLENSEHDDDGESNISCFECKRVFTNRKALYRHGQQTNHRLRLRRATKVKGGPIRCTKCKYSTDKSMNFRAHLRRNHSETPRDNVF